MSNFRKKQQKRGYPRVVRGLKSGVMGLFEYVRLSRVKKTKSSIIQNTKAPTHSFGCFRRKFERAIFERTILSPFCQDIKNMEFKPSFT
jgi:hypothetical protein